MVTRPRPGLGHKKQLEVRGCGTVKRDRSSRGGHQRPDQPRVGTRISDCFQDCSRCWLSLVRVGRCSQTPTPTPHSSSHLRVSPDATTPCECYVKPLLSSQVRGQGQRLTGVPTLWPTESAEDPGGPSAQVDPWSPGLTVVPGSATDHSECGNHRSLRASLLRTVGSTVHHGSL